jgi:hypothetical protein
VQWPDLRGRESECCLCGRVGQPSSRCGFWGFSWEESVVGFEFGQEAVEFEDRESGLGCKVVFTCSGFEEVDTGVVQGAEYGWGHLKHEG